jgi:hypothetical protein
MQPILSLDVTVAIAASIDQPSKEGVVGSRIP